MIGQVLLVSQKERIEARACESRPKKERACLSAGKKDSVRENGKMGTSRKRQA